MDRRPDISIIGPGKVGTAIGILAAKAGYRIVAVAGRTARSARSAAERIGGGVRAVAPAEAASAGGLVLLTVPDEAIQVLCEELAGRGAFAEGAIVAHCCGALGSEVLAAAQSRCGCAVGSMHPLQTFPTVEAAVAKLPGTWCFAEGDDKAVAALVELAGAIGAKAVRMKAAGRALYHASAVMACNYLVALIDAALALAQRAGIDRQTAAKALEPLVRATVDNVAELGPEKALTGPIARGDRGTVERHLKALAECPPELANFYRAAGAWTADLARRKGTIDGATAEALRQLLNPEKAKE